MTQWENGGRLEVKVEVKKTHRVQDSEGKW